jgi:predicted ATPase/Tfp pilus assembly protein PilF
MFPKPRTRFVGRGTDLSRIAESFSSGVPLVTLWGPPGIGKTRLAIEVGRRESLRPAARLREAWFCDLSAARDVAEICAAVAQGVGIAPSQTRVTPDWLATALARRGPGLLVLDNLEQVVAHAAATVGLWSEAAPEICFLATSRERLRLQCELTHEVLPLGEHAAELFVDRARACAGADFTFDAEQVSTLVAHLEGNPLAIELAAARLDVLGIGGLLSRVARPLDLLVGGARDVGSKHATLRRCIESSFRLLDVAEQKAFAYCAVFRSSFSLEAAEAVLHGEAGISELDVLQALRNRSLLRRVSSGGAVRFAFYDAVRAYACEVLEARFDAPVIRDRHARYFLDQAGPSPDSHQADILEAAGHWLAADGDDSRERARRVALALSRIEPTRASDAIVDLLGCALARACPADVEGDEAVALAHRARGLAMQLRGRLVEARQELERALAIARELHSLALVGRISLDLGAVHHQVREMSPARCCYETALAIAEKLRDDVGRARCLGNLGAVHHDLRRYVDALDHYRRALAIVNTVREPSLEGTLLANTGIVLQERGAFAAAKANYHAALARLSEAGSTADCRLAALVLTNLGFLYHEMGELELARASHEQALSSLRQIVDPRSEALCLGRLAMALAALDRHEEAFRWLERAETLVRRLDDRLAMALLRLFRAFIAACARDTPETVTRDRVAEAHAPAHTDNASLVAISDDARTAVRLIEALLAARGARSAVLVLGPDARWLTGPDGTRHDLVNRAVLRRLLIRLVESHRDAPGSGLTIDDLRITGWPDERVMPAAAVNRVYVALTELRRRGLKNCLVCKEGAYLISPSIRVELSDG